MVKYCPKCGYPNPDDSMYCMRCGTQLPISGQQPATSYLQQPAYPPPPTQQPGYPQQPPGYPPYQQQPYPPGYPRPKRRVPIKAIIGAVVAVVVVLVVVLVVLPIFFSSSYPVTTSDFQSVYGGSWKILNNESGTVSFSSSALTVSYYNGTTKSYPITPHNDTCSVFIVGNVPDAYLSKLVFVTFEYHSTNGSGVAFECVVYPNPGTKFYTELTTLSVTQFAFIFGVPPHNVYTSGNIMYGYSNNLDGYGAGVVILNKGNGELVIIVGLPYTNSQIAAKLASYV